MSDTKSCLVAECGRKVSSKGYCMTHYQRMRNGTDMDAPIRDKRERKEKVAVFENVNEAEIAGDGKLYHCFDCSENFKSDADFLEVTCSFCNSTRVDVKRDSAGNSL